MVVFDIKWNYKCNILFIATVIFCRLWRMEDFMNYVKKVRPERVIQFGEGGFLRGFFDWMLSKINESSEFNGSVVVVQPIKEGFADTLNSQNGLYTHIIRGVEGVDTRMIDVISRCVKPYDDFEEYLKLAENPELRFVVSNTTESGIVFSDADKITDAPPATFPAKLTRLLMKRFELGLCGFIFLPCELIDRAGDALRDCILKYADLWSLGEDFKEWIVNENVFTNTLVDRINTGYPRGEELSLGYEDKMVNTSEYFHLWVIETDYDIESELPFKSAGLNVIVTKDKLETYRTRKVRILNGAHTSTVAHAILSGFETVCSCMENEEMREYIRRNIFEEIIPTLDLPKEELVEYAESVLERFANPYVKHLWSSISLNSVSKFKVRVLPSILEYEKRFGKAPKGLLFSLARLIELYKTDFSNDAPEVLEFMKKSSIREILKNEKLWGSDLSRFEEELNI